MSERVNFYGIERVGPCRAVREGGQYHPRYARSEWDKFRDLERRANRRATFWLCFVLACLLGMVFAVPRLMGM